MSKANLLGYCPRRLLVSSLGSLVLMNSGDGDAWSSFPHEHAPSRVYRWVSHSISISDSFREKMESADTAILINTSVLRLHSGTRKIRSSRNDTLASQAIKVSSHLINLTAGNHAEDVKELYYYIVCPHFPWALINRIPLQLTPT